MNIIFFTQSNSLDVFYELEKRILSKQSITASYYVADKRHYQNFLKKNENFESNHKVIKEWDIFEQIKTKPSHSESISHLESRFGDPFIWTPYATDRRLSFGKNFSLTQSYRPQLDYESISSLLINSMTKLDLFFQKTNPDIICTIYTSTFGDCLAHQYAKNRGIKSLDLRLSRLKNFVMFVDGVNEPPLHIKKIYDNIDKYSDPRTVNEAEEYVKKVISKNTLYEGVITKSKERSSFSNLIKSFFKIPKNIKNLVKYSGDNQYKNPFTSFYYKSFFNKIRRTNINFRYSGKIVGKNFLANNEYILYPLHTEPELVLSQFARPYLNQIEVIRNIRYSTPFELPLLVKEHPMMFGKRKSDYYRKILEIPNTKLVKFDLTSDEALVNCKLLAIIRGAMGLEAVIKKIPVVALGKTLFQILPSTMYRFSESPYELEVHVKELLENYEYNHLALINYLQAVILGSVPVNLVTDLLGKKGRYKVNKKYRSFEEHPDLDTLAKYLLKRIEDK